MILCMHDTEVFFPFAHVLEVSQSVGGQPISIEGAAASCFATADAVAAPTVVQDITCVICCLLASFLVRVLLSYTGWCVYEHS